jgi:Chaperone of endosialidase
MGGGDTKTTNTTQDTQTNPWAPAQPLLTSILGQLGGVNTGVTPGQQSAVNNLQQSASNIPDLSGPATNAVTSSLGYDPSQNESLLTSAYNSLKGNLGNTASGAELNPYSTPGFSDALNTASDDAMNRIKSVYAASGRDPSGAGSFGQSAGRGILQATAPIVQAQYNQNKANQMGAATDLFSAGTGTGNALTQQDLSGLQARLSGLTAGGLLPGLITQGATTQLGAANAAQGLPLSNIQGLESLVNPIASLGGQSQGTGQQTTESSKSLFSNILGGISGLGALNGLTNGGLMSGLGSIGSSLLAFSDERLKENIEPVGETYDGKQLYSYNYIDDDVPRIGLLAQDLLRDDPESVHMHPSGFLMVDYGRALAPAHAEAA